jgi:hypothetical protein
MYAQLLIQAFSLFAPIVADIINKHRAANNGAMPTNEEMIAAFNAHVDESIAKADVWLAAHPKV